MAREQETEQARAYARIVARAWSDEAFKQRLLADPATVLKEYGIPVSDGVQVHVHEASATQLHLVLPPRPAGVTHQLSEEQLEALAGGGAIAGGESAYQEMWAQDVAAMIGYHAG